MIDWITAIVDFDHSADCFDNGVMISVEKTGDIRWEYSMPLTIESSYSSKVRIRSHHDSVYTTDVGERRFSKIYIDGNPLKFLYGHNVFGPNDLLALSYSFFVGCLDVLGLSFNDIEIMKIKHGDFLLNRVDCTDYLQFDSNRDVELVLNRFITSASYRHRGSAANAKGTCYFGKHSTWYALKIYNKYKELNKHNISKKVINRSEIKKWVSNKLRFELVMRKRELQRIGLRCAKDWSSDTVPYLMSKYINDQKISMSTKNQLSDVEMIDLPGKLRSTYALWQTGINVFSVLSSSTFYTHKKELLAFGIDISSQPPADDNVIKFSRSIEIDYNFQNISL